MLDGRNLQFYVIKIDAAAMNRYAFMLLTQRILKLPTNPGRKS
jgi:hypothetical protein